MKELSRVLSPEKFSASPEILLCYAFDASGNQALPSAVVWPESADDVIAVSKFSYQRGIPLCPRGAGTGMTGGATPLEQAIVLSFERMNRILEIDEENLTALVEPGVINGALQRELRPLGPGWLEGSGLAFLHSVAEGRRNVGMQDVTPAGSRESRCGHNIACHPGSREPKPTRQGARTR